MAGNADFSALLDRFGLSQFRRGQQEVIEAVGGGQDVMCVMPTGGGKSLCYQLPSLARSGTTIVISPLIALMKDQVDSLEQLGIKAKLINSSLSVSEQADVMQLMADGELDLVYVAPERLRNGRFLEAVSSANVSLLAVDEAHCVSEWGHDFRPDYSRLGHFRERYLGGVQTIALTATATQAVRDDISMLLGLQSPRVFVTGFARDNLTFSVTHSKADTEKDETVVRYLKQQPGAGIIYAATRKRCEELAAWLPERARRPIGVYHGGLEPDQRRRVQDAFMSDQLSAIVATNAFGMGIDKPDIRFVIHYNMPGTLEAYYQEAGRAGRDGQPSDCMLLFSYQDRYVQEFFIENRYPSRETVRDVYEFLLSREQDPIELTLEQVREAINSKDGTESIGTAETLLARAGVLKRLDSNSNHAVVRIDSDADTLLDFLPPEAKLRRRVMKAIETVVGTRRHEDVFVRPQRLASIADVDREQLTRTLRELRKLKAFDYVPPFRGRAVHIVQRELAFADLDIDFEELDRRKSSEYEKLEAVIGLARTSRCRQRVILDYFGEQDSANCGLCDRCQRTKSASGGAREIAFGDELQEIDRDDLVRAIRVILSGATRMHGRFGKTLVAQMLSGSKNKKLQQWKLHRLSTYGLMSDLRQSEIVEAMDRMIEAGLLSQKEVDDRRPTVDITSIGREVMHNKRPVPDSLTLPLLLAKKLAKASRGIESGDVQTSSAGSSDEDDSRLATSDGDSNDHAEPHADLVEALTRWRRKVSAAMGVPAYRILTNATIDRLAESQPTSLEELESVSGIGPVTLSQFGTDLIALIGRQRGEPELNGATPVAEKPPAEGVDRPPVEGADQLPVAGDRPPGAGDQPKSDQEPATGDANRDDPLVIDPASPDPSPSGHTNSHESGPERIDLDRTGQTAEDAGSSRDLVSDDSGSDPDVADHAESNRDDAYWTWLLFRDGYSASQVSAIRRRALSALADDLIVAAGNGHKVQPEWIGAPDEADRIRGALTTLEVGG